MKKAAGTKGSAKVQPKAMTNPAPGMYPNMKKGPRIARRKDKRKRY